MDHYPAAPVLELPESCDLVTFAVDEPYRRAAPTWCPVSAGALAVLLHMEPAERVYVGERSGDGAAHLYVEEGGRRRPLRHVVYHSPDGLEFGFGGSGPADTALSILADYCGEMPTPEHVRHGELRCWALHQAFKWRFIAPASQAGFRLPASVIAVWLEEQRGDTEPC